MKALSTTAGLLAAAQIWGSATAFAGPWEEGMAAYNRGDYVPAVQFVRPLAQAGNAKAQALLGVMYRRGEGVARSSAIAFMWLGLAAKQGDPKAKAQLKTVARTLSSDELSRARAMMQACESSNYSNCAY